MAAFKKQGRSVPRISTAGDVNRIKAFFVFSCLFGFTWILGAATIFDYDKIVDGTKTQCLVLKAFHYLFAICNSMQGFTIFLFHIVLNKTVRRQIAQLQRIVCIYESDKRKSREYKADDESKDSKDTLKATTITTLNKSSTSASHGKQEELLEEVDIEMYNL